MAWTYTTLSQALQDFLETDETTFVNNIPIFVRNAEDRILKKVQLPDFRKNVTGTMTSSDEYVSVPTDFLAPYSMAVDNSGYEYLVFKDVSYIREVYPSSSTEGTPRFYALFNDDYFIVAPTPDSGYTTELHYFYRPASIVDNATSWLGTNAEAALFYASVVEGYTFLKGDPDLMKQYEEMAGDAIADLKLLGEGRNRTDTYRRR